jgi:hypothetical protein
MLEVYNEQVYDLLAPHMDGSRGDGLDLISSGRRGEKEGFAAQVRIILVNSHRVPVVLHDVVVGHVHNSPARRVEKKGGNFSAMLMIW